MFADLKRLGKHTLIYGVGDVLGRISAFVLLPLYTNYLSTEEFGILEMLYITGTIMQLLLGNQLAHGALRIYYDYDLVAEKNKVFSTAVLASFFTLMPLTFLFYIFSPNFSDMLFASELYAAHFSILSLTVVIGISKEVLFAYVRAVENSILYVCCSVSELVIKVVLAVYTVVYLDLSILGVLMSNLIGIGVIWVFLLIFTLKKCGLGINLKTLKELLLYIYPLIVAAIISAILMNSDRFFIKSFVSLSAVGLYALAYRFSLVLKIIVISPFTKGYGPFRFSIMKQDNAKEIYARVTTYFLVLLCFMSIGIGTLSKEIIEIMSDPSYWSAHTLIPILLIFVIFQGLYYMVQTGVYINKRTGLLPFIFAGATVFGIGLDFVLVPRFGVYGAASVITFAYFSIVVATYFTSQKLFYIKYEWFRMIKIIIVCVSLFWAVSLVSYSNVYVSLAVKASMCLTYPLLLYAVGVFDRNELAHVPLLRMKLF